jgi:hypothetical protein
LSERSLESAENATLRHATTGMAAIAPMNMERIELVFCGFSTSFENLVHMHVVYNSNRTWLAPLTQSASVAIHDQSG